MKYEIILKGAIVILAFTFIGGLTAMIVNVQKVVYRKTHIVVREYYNIVDPELGICMYKGVDLLDREVKVEAACCMYIPGDTITNKDKFFKIR